MKPPKQYFDFYLHRQDEVRRGACFSPQKHKILHEISKSQHDQGCIIKKVKLNEENTDFVLTDFTTITKLKLAYDKAEHQLNFISLAWYVNCFTKYTFLKLFQNINILYKLMM